MLKFGSYKYEGEIANGKPHGIGKLSLFSGNREFLSEVEGKFKKKQA